MPLSPEYQAIIKAIQDNNAQVLKQIQKGNEKLLDRINAVEAKTDSVLGGFPDGDPDGHREYHKTIIERQQLRNEIMRGVVVKMSQGGLIAAILAVLGLAWLLIKMELTR